ncbi:MAG: hypothetical protein HY760_00875 [Nitrospirae bacterium]|nr:hypothetical protein [Nitrospirota bacterium]
MTIFCQRLEEGLLPAKLQDPDLHQPLDHQGHPLLRHPEHLMDQDRGPDAVEVPGPSPFPLHGFPDRHGRQDPIPLKGGLHRPDGPLLVDEEGDHRMRIDHGVFKRDDPQEFGDLQPGGGNPLFIVGARLFLQPGKDHGNPEGEIISPVAG